MVNIGGCGFGGQPWGTHADTGRLGHWSILGDVGLGSTVGDSRRHRKAWTLVNIGGCGFGVNRGGLTQTQVGLDIGQYWGMWVWGQPWGTQADTGRHGHCSILGDGGWGSTVGDSRRHR